MPSRHLKGQEHVLHIFCSAGRKAGSVLFSVDKCYRFVSRQRQGRQGT